MNNTINEIDIVALTQDLPKLGLNKGQTGTVVDISESGVFLVEFSNEKGEMISLESLKREQITLVTSYTQEKTKIMGYQLKAGQLTRKGF
jgi:endo-beta-N-acetylglucosaminidase D